MRRSKIYFKVIGNNITADDIDYLKSEINAFNKSRVWNGCQGLSIERTIFDDKALGDIGAKADGKVYFRDRADAAAVVRFWLQFTDNFDGNMMVYIEDDLGGVLYGIPRLIKDGMLWEAIDYSQLESLVEKFPAGILRDQELKKLEKKFSAAKEGAWDNIPDFTKKISLKCDNRLLFHLRSRLNKNMSQSIVDIVRGFIAKAKSEGQISVKAMFNRRDVKLELQVPEEFYNMLNAFSQKVKLNQNEVINLALEYSMGLMM